MKEVLILVISTPNLKTKGKMLFKMVDCKNNTDLISLNVGDKEILGRVKSGLFSFVDGHFYFGN